MPSPSPRLLAVARGEATPDLVIRGAKVFVAFTKEWLELDVAVVEGVIAGFEPLVDDETPVIDGSGKYLIPGLIDAHMHIESSKLLPVELARVVVPLGTTTIVVDPHEIAGVLGADGVRWLLDACDGLPLSVHAMAPSTVPASPLESPREALDAEALRGLLQHPRMRGIGEMMNAPGVAHGDAHSLATLALVDEAARVDGHAPGVTGALLDAYVAAGVSTDHEATTLAEALEKRRKGAWVLLREATNARNLRDLLPLVREHGPEHCAFCTDDREPGTLLEEGHIDQMCRIAVAEGISPEDTILLATLHAAQCHGLDRVGAIAPGWAADLLLLDDLTDFRPSLVLQAGRIVARDGRPVAEGDHPAVAASPSATTDTTAASPSTPDRGTSTRSGEIWPRTPFATNANPIPAWVRDTVNLAPVTAASFALAAPGGRVRVIRAIPDQLLTSEEIVEPRVEGGLVVADPDRDLAKIAVIERHHATGRIGLGLVTGFGLRSGAFAGTVSHDAHNVIAVGTRDEDLLACVERLRKLGGGLVVCDEGRVIAELPLPVAGLLSDRSARDVHIEQERLDASLAARGVHLPSPFMALSFLGLSVIPDLKITDHGLVDAARLQPVSFGVDG